MVNVILPTAARPEFLRAALESIEQQTAREHIQRVFVSENGGDRASSEVCQQFPDLPITYIFREPAVTPLEHMRLLMQECLADDFTAILHDDATWQPAHLERALAALTAHREVSCYGCSVHTLDSDGATDCDAEQFAWMGAHYPAEKGVWTLSHSNVLLASLMGVVVHYSSLVARTSALERAAFVYDLGNPFDHDRMILMALSVHGPILYDAERSVVVRDPEDREAARVAGSERARRMIQTTDWMIGLSGKPWAMVGASFLERLIHCPDEAAKQVLVREATARPWCLPELVHRLDRVQDAPFFFLYKMLTGHEAPEVSRPSQT